jgi:hypothetical protein
MDITIQNENGNGNGNGNGNEINDSFTSYRTITLNSSNRDHGNTISSRCVRECIPCQYSCMRIMEVILFIAYTVFYVEYSIISTIQTESICKQFNCIHIWYSMIIQGIIITGQLLLHIYLAFTSNFIRDCDNNYISFYKSKWNIILSSVNILVLIGNGIEIYIVTITCEELEYSEKMFSIFLNMFSVVFFLGLSLVSDIFQPYVVAENEDEYEYEYDV